LKSCREKNKEVEWVYNECKVNANNQTHRVSLAESDAEATNVSYEKCKSVLTKKPDKVPKIESREYQS
jgi:hypothetical protein